MHTILVYFKSFLYNLNLFTGVIGSDSAGLFSGSLVNRGEICWLVVTLGENKDGMLGVCGVGAATSSEINIRKLRTYDLEDLII